MLVRRNYTFSLLKKNVLSGVLPQTVRDEISEYRISPKILYKIQVENRIDFAFSRANFTQYFYCSWEHGCHRWSRVI